MSTSISRGVSGVNAEALETTLVQRAVPIVLAPNGTVAANGTVTLGTALPVIYSGGVWLRLPAGAVVGGSAGVYYTVMSSTTVGQVYTDYADPTAADFVPDIPASLAAAVGSNVAYTQATGSDVVLMSFRIPGGLLGKNGELNIYQCVAQPNNANNKICRIKLGATTINSVTNTTSTADARPALMRNAGAQNLNFCTGFVGMAQGGSTYPYIRTTINTAVDQQLTITGQLAVATDYLCLDGFSIEIVPQ